MTVWIVWRITNWMLPGMRKVELVTADGGRAVKLAAGSIYLVAEEHAVEDAPLVLAPPGLPSEAVGR